MPTDTRLLALLQLASPGYPTGAFAYSHGLEAAVRAGLVHDAGSTLAWLDALLAQGSARADAVWISRGHQADGAAALIALDAEARAFAASRERVQESQRQGAAFVQATNAVWGLDLPAVAYPLAVGQAARRLGLGGCETIAAFTQAFIANLAFAALRLVPLGQTETQRIVAALAPDCACLGQDLAEAGPDDLFSNSFLSDIMAMRHETQEPRVFQT